MTKPRRSDPARLEQATRAADKAAAERNPNTEQRPGIRGPVRPAGTGDTDSADEPGE